MRIDRSWPLSDDALKEGSWSGGLLTGRRRLDERPHITLSINLARHT